MDLKPTSCEDDGLKSSVRFPGVGKESNEEALTTGDNVLMCSLLPAECAQSAG